MPNKKRKVELPEKPERGLLDAEKAGLAMKEFSHRIKEMKEEVPETIAIEATAEGIDIPAEEPVIAEAPIKEDDIVYFLGGAEYSTSDAKEPFLENLRGGPARVHCISSEDKPYRYLVVHTNSISNVYGWVAEHQLKKI